MRPVLSVIIPTRNRVRTLGRTLESWRDHAAGVAFEVIVVDDGSDDGTSQSLHAAAATDPRIRCFRQQGAGPATARNLAIAHAEGDLVLFTGDDIRPAPGLVDGHVAVHKEGRDSRFVLGRTEWDVERPVTRVMRHITGFGGQQFRYSYLRDGERLGFKYFYGSNLSVSRKTLAEAQGPFDASFHGAALEDADLGYRLMGRRREIEYHAALLAFHDHPYDVSGFTARQRQVGLATAAMARKHPEVAGEFGWDVVSAAIETARRGGKFEGKGASLDTVEAAERHLLEGLSGASGPSARGLDRLYLGLFWYFQARGIAEACVAKAALPAVLSILMRDALACSLRGARALAGGVIEVHEAEHLARAASLLESGGRRSLPECLREEFSMRAREWRYALATRKTRRP